MAAAAVIIYLGIKPQQDRSNNQGQEQEFTQNRIMGEPEDTAIEYEGNIQIEDLGNFTFNPGKIETTRNDLFQQGHFSVFDILVHLDKTGAIDLDYSFDEEKNTHLINSINGKKGWWYQAYYDGGWPEKNVFRMDHFPYKDKMTVKIIRVDQRLLDNMYKAFQEEVERRQKHDGKIIIPEVVIKSKSEKLKFNNVEVTPHHLRKDIFQEGVITAIDIILSLGDQGELTYDLKWQESIGSAEVVRSYWLVRINNDQSRGTCGFVYETGPRRFGRTNHIHLPSDARIINSPEYAEWFWICL